MTTHTQVKFKQIALAIGDFTHTNGLIELQPLENSHIKAAAGIATDKIDGAVTSIVNHGLAASATSDTTQAGNIVGGTLNSARLPDLVVSDFAAAAVIEAAGANLNAVSDSALLSEGAITKLIRDNLEGLDHKDACITASSQNIPGSETAGEFTLTNTGKYSIGQKVLVAQNRILLKDQTDKAQNGVFKLKAGNEGGDFEKILRFVSSNIADIDDQKLTITSASTDQKIFEFNDAVGLFNGQHTVKPTAVITLDATLANNICVIELWGENESQAFSWPASAKWKIKIQAGVGNATVFGSVAGGYRTATLGLDDFADSAALATRVRSLLSDSGVNQATNAANIPAGGQFVKTDTGGSFGVTITSSCHALLVNKTGSANVTATQTAGSGFIKVATNGIVNNSDGSDNIAAKFNEAFGRAAGFKDSIMTGAIDGGTPSIVTLTERSYYGIEVTVGTIQKDAGIVNADIDNGTGSGTAAGNFGAGGRMVLERTIDADAASELNNASVWIAEGKYASTAWVVSGTFVGVPGATGGTGDHSWVKWSGAGLLSFGTGLRKVDDKISFQMARNDGTLADFSWSAPNLTEISAAGIVATDTVWEALNLNPQVLVVYNGIILEPAASNAGVGTNGDYWMGGSAGGINTGRLDIKFDPELLNATTDKVSIIYPY